jgi:hypothetical protein
MDDERFPIRVTPPERILAAERWDSYHGVDSFDDQFMHTNPISYNISGSRENSYYVTERTGKLIRLLNSPHWRTLLKVYLIRQEVA